MLDWTHITSPQFQSNEVFRSLLIINGSPGYCCNIRLGKSVGKLNIQLAPERVSGSGTDYVISHYFYILSP